MVYFETKPEDWDYEFGKIMEENFIQNTSNKENYEYLSLRS